MKIGVKDQKSEMAIRQVVLNTVTLINTVNALIYLTKSLKKKIVPTQICKRILIHTGLLMCFVH